MWSVKLLRNAIIAVPMDPLFQTAGLVAGVGCRLAASLGRHPLGPLPCGLIVVATFAAMSVLRLPLAWVLPVVGGAACALTWRKLPA